MYTLKTDGVKKEKANEEDSNVTTGVSLKDRKSPVERRIIHTVESIPIDRRRTYMSKHTAVIICPFCIPIDRRSMPRAKRKKQRSRASGPRARAKRLSSAHTNAPLGYANYTVEWKPTRKIRLLEGKEKREKKNKKRHRECVIIQRSINHRDQSRSGVFRPENRCVNHVSQILDSDWQQFVIKM